MICVLLILLAFNETMNYDEFFSMNWTALSWKEMMKVLEQDVHPPLYYIGLKLWRELFGYDDIYIARLFSILPSILIAAIGGRWIYKIAGAKSTLWYLILLFGNPFMFQKAVEIRMYPWTAFWIIMNAICLYNIIVRESIEKKQFVYFFMTGLLTAYNHYFGILIMIMTYSGAGIYFIFRKNKKKILAWLIGCGITILGYTPWLFVAIRQVKKVNGDYWIEFPESRLGIIRELFYSVIPYSEKIYLGIFMIVPIITLILLIREKKPEIWWTLVTVCSVWGLFVIGMLYMYVMDRPIMTSRYLIPGIILAILGIAMLVKKIPFVMIIPFLGVFLICGVDTFSGLYNLQRKQTTEKFIEFSQNNMKKKDKLYFLDDGYGYLKFCLEYYIDKPEIYELEEGEMPLIEENTWYLETERMAGDNRNKEIEKDMEYKGEYSFGTEQFSIYYR